MDTKSDEAEPGRLGDTRPLTGEERAMLDRLRDGGGAAVVDSPAEESSEFAAAADADAPLPAGAPGGPGGPPDGPPDGHAGPGPLDPVFREPER